MIVSIIYFIFILGLIVLVHEFGHFIFAKMFKIHVYEFSIGMGPVIYSTKKRREKKLKAKKKVSETIYCIRAIPVGGFVQLAGEGLEEDKNVKKENLIDKKNILPEIGLGILTPIVLILVSIILILLGITSSFGLLLLAISFILIGLSTSIFIIAINNLICNKLKIQKNIGNFGMLIVTAAVLWLVGLIPYVGGIIGILAVLIGLGIVIYYLITRDKKENNKKD